MANDPNTIQYVIQEDGFWYVASKDRTPGVPEITVSAKGVANGLSEEYNDGWDFGPDSYSPTSTSAIPYTETSGIEEAINYGRNVKLSPGMFTIYVPIVIQYPGQRLIGAGQASSLSSPDLGTMIYVNEAGIDAIQISNINNPNSPNDLNISDFRIVFNDSLSSTGHGINCTDNVANIGTFSHGYFARISTHNCQTIAYNFINFFNSVFILLTTTNCNGILSITSYGDGQDDAGNSTFIDIKDFGSTLTQTNPDITVNGSASDNNGGGVQQTVFIRPEIEVYSSIEALNINNANNIQFINMDLDQLDTTLPTDILVMENAYQIIFDTLMFGLSANMSTDMLFTNCGDIWFNDPIILGSGSTVGVDSSTSGVNHGGIKWNGDIDQSVRANGGSLNISFVFEINPPQVLATTAGTTAGTVYESIVTNQVHYKKMVFVFDGYENDTTTNQTIDFVIGFNNIASITSNTTGLTISASTAGITITAPDSTTTYSGIVIVEGY